MDSDMSRGNCSWMDGLRSGWIGGWKDKETESVRKTERVREMVDDTQIGWTWNRAFLHRCLDIIITLHSPPPFEVQSQWYNVVTKFSPDYKLLIKRIHLLHGTSGHHSSCLSTVGYHIVCTLIARFMGPTWGPTGTDRTQVGPMLAPWIFLSG